MVIHYVPPVLGYTVIISTIISAAISTALSFVVYALTPKPKPSQAPVQNPTLSTRGSWIPRLVGKRRLGPVMTWAGVRSTTVSSNQVQYYEHGLHVLCVGPGYAIHQIRSNEKIIWNTPIYKSEHPSGSVFHYGESQFMILWGDDSDPVPDEFSRFMSFVSADGSILPLATKFPRTVKVIWQPARLGFQDVWPSLDYVVEVRPEPAVEFSVPAWIDLASSSLDDEGVNPAIALYCLLNDPYPYGMGIPPQQLDFAAFDAAAVILDTEHLPMNILIDAGNDASNIISGMLKQLDLMLNQVRGRLTPFLVRPIPDDTDIPDITVDAVSDPFPEEERQLGPQGPDRITFEINDNYTAYRPYQLPLRRDWQMRGNARAQTITETIDQVTDRITMNKIARRRLPLFGANAHSIKMTAGRDARLPDFYPGIAFTYPGLGQMRLLNKTIRVDSGKVDIEAIHDIYTLGTNLTSPQWDGTGDQFYAAEPDLLDVPMPLYPGSTQVTSRNGIIVPIFSGEFYVLRVRANPAIIGAQVWISHTGDTGMYTLVGNQDVPSPGGGLLDAITAIDDLSTTTITFSNLNDDIANVQDLTGDDLAYNDGHQLVAIGHEVMFLRSITPVSGSTYQLNGLTRARYGTAAVAHSIGASVVIFRNTDIVPLTSIYVEPGSTLWVKVLPAIAGDIVALADVTPVSFVVPDDYAATITLLLPSGGETMSFPFDITWRGVGTPAVTLEYSLDDGATWTTIATGLANTGRYSWSGSGTSSTTTARVRASWTAHSISDTSPIFTIP